MENKIRKIYETQKVRFEPFYNVKRINIQMSKGENYLPLQKLDSK